MVEGKAGIEGVTQTSNELRPARALFFQEACNCRQGKVVFSKSSNVSLPAPGK